ncbi:MAG TPA: hypothetical protein VFV53_04555 [Candidatus Limnocylindrales bacterium]|nr:hypothetical protein [Candidatus Limnocylindrales bacterium]
MYLTTSAGSERVEDAIRELAADDAADAERAAGRLHDLDERIATLEVPFDEWETVYRERLQLERLLLGRLVRRRAGSADREASPGSAVPGREGREAALPIRVAGLAGLGLIAIDVALLLAERVRPPDGRVRGRRRPGREGRWWR